MFRTRLITASIILPIVFAILFYASPLWFYILSGVLTLLASIEWMQLTDIKHPILKLGYLMILTGLLIVSVHVAMDTLLWVAIFWWALALFWVLIYPNHQNVWTQPLVLAVLGIEVLMPFWLAINVLRNDFSINTLIFLLVLIWAADTGAYLAGHAFGRHKLLPLVSPGKTIEGALGGLLLALCITLLVLVWYPLQGMQIIYWLLISVSTVLISILGDLVESMVKRHKGVKDSGVILPGHGGIMDRIDSLTAAAPWFLLMMHLSHLPHL